MLARSKPIGHAGDVIGDGPRQVAAAGMVSRHGRRIPQIGLEKLAHHLLRPNGRLHDPWVAVQMGEEETLERARLQVHLLAKTHQRRTLAHRIGTVRAGVV